MKSKLVTLEEAERYLCLDPGSRFLERFLYGNEAQIKPKNLDRKTKKEKYLYDLSEIISIFIDPQKMMLLCKNIGKGNGFVSMTHLSEIFNTSKSSLITAKQKGLITSLLEKIFKVYDDPNFYVEENFSGLDQMIDINDCTTRKFLFSKKIRNREAFFSKFSALNGVLLPQHIGKTKKRDGAYSFEAFKAEKIRLIDFSHDSYSSLRVFYSDILPIMLIRFNPEKWLSFTTDQAKFSILDSQVNIFSTDYIISEEDAINIRKYLSRKGALVMGMSGKEWTISSNGYDGSKEGIKKIVKRTELGTNTLPEKVRWVQMGGVEILSLLYFAIRAIEEGSIEIEIPVEDIEIIFELAEKEVEAF